MLFIAGVTGTLLAIPLGLQQRDPKVLLAYSSIAKMGAMMSALGLALIEPGAAPAILAAVTLFAAHHGLCKGALFIGVGLVKTSSSQWPLVLLALPALALAGLPFTSGALAKALLSDAVPEAMNSWCRLFLWLLPVAAVGTALLMARLLYLMHEYAAQQRSTSLLPTLPWLGLLSTLLLAQLAYKGSTESIKNLWPIAIAVATAIGVIRARPAALIALVGRVPPGDIIAPLSRLTARLTAARRMWTGRQRDFHGRHLTLRLAPALGRMAASTPSVENTFLRSAGTGLAWLAVAIAVFLLRSKNQLQDR